MNVRSSICYLIAFTLVALPADIRPRQVTEHLQLSSIRKISDIPYAVVGGVALNLDIYMPEGAENPPLLIWVHPGAWRNLSKDAVRPEYLVSHGYVMASVDFRQSGVARFPAQVHDINAAIRFLRANSSNYEFDATRIGILGASSGGHLAALVGVTNGNTQLDGSVGEYLDESSDVHAIVTYSGASNLATILQQSTPHGLKVRVPALEALLGGQPDELPELAELAELASPVYHLDSSDPALLLIHGDQDPQMPINQAHELHGAYQKLGLDSKFEVIYGAGHRGEEFFDKRVNETVKLFLDSHLR